MMSNPHITHLFQAIIWINQNILPLIKGTYFTEVEYVYCQMQTIDAKLFMNVTIVLVHIIQRYKRAMYMYDDNFFGQG